MTELIERAKESVDHLDAIIKRCDSNALLVDDPTHATNQAKKVAPYGVPEEVIRGCEAAVTAIFEALRSHRRHVRSRIAGRPPERWGDLRRVAEHQGLPPSVTKAALIDALAVLERHVSDDTPHLVALAFLIGNLDHKIKTRPTPYVFRAPCNPNTSKFVYFFDPEINGDIDCSVKRSIYEGVFEGQPCTAFLRTALDELTGLE